MRQMNLKIKQVKFLCHAEVEFFTFKKITDGTFFNSTKF